jgi:hypothetical protein
LGGGRRVGLLTGGLDALELVEGAEEGAFDAGFVAAEDGEGVGVSAEGIGVLEVEEAEFEEAGLDAAEAGEAPLGHDDLLDEGGFEGAGGKDAPALPYLE